MFEAVAEAPGSVKVLHPASFKKVFLKEISELSNYIDRSQLMPSLGGYLVYCHRSWVAFIKEVDEFVQDFLSVVQRLPSCISTLQALSRLAAALHLQRAAALLLHQRSHVPAAQEGAGSG
ncbi:hypothetical protein KUCAC02_019692 [Chaenocephalus aceratus]|uniref:Uncharacterized protein n=1 Tax=Chaenocephalus aceratus TaxID=36190 RepID=A0ACB9VQJ0_CHAAC|nr:hypothetical protein KUCAC02_019692 [Chaenocephalus aceratus]